MLRNLGYFAIVALIALMCSQSALAQTGLGASQNLNASAVVYLPLSITSPVDFTFGNIMLNGNPNVNPKTGATTKIISGSSVGGMHVSGSAAARVIFSWVGPVDLAHGTDHLKYTPDVYGGDAGAQGSSVALTSGSTAVTLTGGNCQVWVGGTLYAADGSSIVPLGQASGTYSGTLALSVDYYQ